MCVCLLVFLNERGSSPFSISLPFPSTAVVLSVLKIQLAVPLVIVFFLLLFFSSFPGRPPPFSSPQFSSNTFLPNSSPIMSPYIPTSGLYSQLPASTVSPRFPTHQSNPVGPSSRMGNSNTLRPIGQRMDTSTPPHHLFPNTTVPNISGPSHGHPRASRSNSGTSSGSATPNLHASSVLLPHQLVLGGSQHPSNSMSIHSMGAHNQVNGGVKVIAPVARPSSSGSGSGGLTSTSRGSSGISKSKTSSAPKPSVPSLVFSKKNTGDIRNRNGGQLAPGHVQSGKTHSSDRGSRSQSVSPAPTPAPMGGPSSARRGNQHKTSKQHHNPSSHAHTKTTASSVLSKSKKPSSAKLRGDTKSKPLTTSSSTATSQSGRAAGKPGSASTSSFSSSSSLPPTTPASSVSNSSSNTSTKGTPSTETRGGKGGKHASSGETKRSRKEEGGESIPHTVSSSPSPSPSPLPASSGGVTPSSSAPPSSTTSPSNMSTSSTASKQSTNSRNEQHMSSIPGNKKVSRSGFTTITRSRKGKAKQVFDFEHSSTSSSLSTSSEREGQGNHTRIGSEGSGEAHTKSKAVSVGANKSTAETQNAFSVLTLENESNGERGSGSGSPSTAPPSSSSTSAVSSGATSSSSTTHGDQRMSMATVGENGGSVGSGSAEVSPSSSTSSFHATSSESSSSKGAGGSVTISGKKKKNKKETASSDRRTKTVHATQNRKGDSTAPPSNNNNTRHPSSTGHHQTHSGSSSTHTSNSNSSGGSGNGTGNSGRGSRSSKEELDWNEFASNNVLSASPVNSISSFIQAVIVWGVSSCASTKVHILSTLSLMWSLHIQAISCFLSEQQMLGICFAFMSVFPSIAHITLFWFPSWITPLLLYSFLMYVLGTDLVVTRHLWRVMLPVLFFTDGSSLLSFVLGLNGGERLAFALLLASCRSGQYTRPLFLCVLSLTLIVALQYGDTLLCQWFILLSSILSLESDSNESGKSRSGFGSKTILPGHPRIRDRTEHPSSVPMRARKRGLSAHRPRRFK